jgi:hypothetical protein
LRENQIVVVSWAKSPRPIWIRDELGQVL